MASETEASRPSPHTPHPGDLGGNGGATQRATCVAIVFTNALGGGAGASPAPSTGSLACAAFPRGGRLLWVGMVQGGVEHSGCPKGEVTEDGAVGKSLAHSSRPPGTRPGFSLDHDSRP